jgi:uncharacterized protein involved in exopolysaccharide biosynthesis
MDTAKRKNIIEISEIIDILWQNRRIIFRNTAVIVVLAIGLSLLQKKTYQATTTILPDIPYLNSLSGKLGGLQDLAAVAGLENNGNVSPTQLYPDVILSNCILKKIIDHRYKTMKYDSLVTLLQYWGFDDPDPKQNYESLLKELQGGVILVDMDKKTTITTITVETEEPQLSADIANQLTKELDYFQGNLRRSNASEQCAFLEKRIPEVEKDLLASENALRIFNEANLSAVQSPRLSMQQKRLSRDIDLNSALYLDLKQQYEYAKIDQIKNSELITVLDSASAPYTGHGKKRATVVFSFLFAFLGTSLYCIAISVYQKWDKHEYWNDLLLKYWTDFRNDIRFKRKHKS